MATASLFSDIYIYFTHILILTSLTISRKVRGKVCAQNYSTKENNKLHCNKTNVSN
jgi:hypothetical protein